MIENPNPKFFKRYRQSLMVIILLMAYIIVTTGITASVSRNSIYYKIINESSFIWTTITFMVGIMMFYYWVRAGKPERGRLFTRKDRRKGKLE